MPELTKEQSIIKQLSDKVVMAQTDIRILDAIKWDDSIKKHFFAKKCKELPQVNKQYYQSHPLPFDVKKKIHELHYIMRRIKTKLGQYHPIANMMIHMCEEYIKACRMLSVRGTKQFANLAVDLYGSPDDVFYPGGPKLSELSNLLYSILTELKETIVSVADEKRYTAQEAVILLQEKLKHYFVDDDKVRVLIDDNIVADAAAGADTIKINSNIKFSDRDIRYLEVHEGWVHMGTTLNGLAQPICTFLSKGAPSSAMTQEGLAVTTEVLTLSSNPSRVLKITNRLHALDMAFHGANFIEVFHYFQQQGLNEDTSFNYATRIFRGSTPDGKPFTKDLAYTKGYLLIYNYIRLSIQQGLIKHIPSLFVGKTLLKDIPVITHYIEEGMITPPKYMPPQFKDLAALSAWLSFSLFLNKIDLDKLAKSFHDILR